MERAGRGGRAGMMGRALSIPFLAFPARFLWSLSPGSELTTVSINGQGSKEEATVEERVKKGEFISPERVDLVPSVSVPCCLSLLSVVFVAQC